jgi:hypothetical protein
MKAQNLSKKLFQKNYKNMSLIKELWAFLKTRKKFWLLPIITIMLLLGVLIVVAQGSAVAPFIYTLF